MEKVNDLSKTNELLQKLNEQNIEKDNEIKEAKKQLSEKDEQILSLENRVRDLELHIGNSNDLIARSTDIRRCECISHS